MRRLSIFICTMALVLFFAGCTAQTPHAIQTPNPAAAQQSIQEPVVLADTENIKITVKGTETTVEDKRGGAVYGYRSKLTAPLSTEQRQAQALGRVSADTETIKIVISGAIIVVTDKTANLIYYIQ